MRIYEKSGYMKSGVSINKKIKNINTIADKERERDIKGIL